MAAMLVSIALRHVIFKTAHAGGSNVSKNKWKEDKYKFIDNVYEVIAIVDKKKFSVSSFCL